MIDVFLEYWILDCLAYSAWFLCVRNTFLLMNVSKDQYKPFGYLIA